MNTSPPPPDCRSANIGLIKGLTFMMFLMFAMTTDAVGVIIPEVIRDFDLGMTAGGAFHYATMTGIALSGLALGFLADRLGRKPAIILGLSLFAVSAFLFSVGEDFGFFVVLLFISGAAIGVFKTAALALIGDISTSTRSHTSTMNMVEGFFGVGAILGPAIVAWLLASGASWKWLYVIAGVMSVGLIITALMVRYPTRAKTSAPPADMKATLAMMRNPYALAFSLGTMLYVGVETAIYVWMPTLLAGYTGSLALLATYALAVFFVLRAAGRFLGAWMLTRFSWTVVMAVSSALIFACFLGSALFGRDSAVWLLPLSGLFMSVIYPTLNSKGISCFPKVQHGAVAGVILFFTCVSAVIAPLAMGAISDLFGGPEYGFVFATLLAGLLFAALGLNAVFDPSRSRLAAQDDTDYAA
jgi:fucose permease